MSPWLEFCNVYWCLLCVNGPCIGASLGERSIRDYGVYSVDVFRIEFGIFELALSF